MRLVCSYCRKVIRHDAGTRVWDVSHVTCPACAEHHGKLWNGLPLAEYLDSLPEPAVVVDGHARVIGASTKLAALFDGKRAAMAGQLCGRAFTCVHARLRDGCGRTAHCRDCALRRTVEHVHATGRPARDVPASLETEQGRMRLRISARAEQGLVRLLVKALAPAPAREER